MKKQNVIIGLLVLFLCLCSAPLWSQTASVKGAAKDENGKPIEGAIVDMVNTENGRKTDLKTNSKGEFSSIGLAPGYYTVTLNKDGKQLIKFEKVPLQAGDERVITFDLAKEKGAGMSEEQQKKVAEAQKENDKIKGLNSTLAQAKQLEAAGNYDQAVTLLQQATQVDPNQDLVWAYLGDAQRGAKKYADAVTSYQKAVDLKPNNGPYLNGLADAYAKSGQTDKAVQTYSAAATADPTNAGTYYFNEGAVFTNTGKMDEAIAAFDKALQIDPKRADAYYWKGVNLMGKATTKGDKMVAPEGTAEAFNKYLELQPTGQYADPAKQMLASIGAPIETNFGKPKSSTPKKK